MVLTKRSQKPGTATVVISFSSVNRPMISGLATIWPMRSDADSDLEKLPM